MEHDFGSFEMKWIKVSVESLFEESQIFQTSLWLAVLYEITMLSNISLWVLKKVLFESSFFKVIIIQRFANWIKTKGWAQLEYGSSWKTSFIRKDNSKILHLNSIFFMHNISIKTRFQPCFSHHFCNNSFTVLWTSWYKVHCSLSFQVRTAESQTTSPSDGLISQSNQIHRFEYLGNHGSGT